MNAENMYDAWDNGDRHEIRQQLAKRNKKDLTDRELMQQWMRPGAIVPVDMNTVRILLDALRERLTQPQRTHWEGCEEVHPECKEKVPPRKWVGLTDDEVTQAMYRADAIFTGPMQFKFAKEIEAKLREKNA